MAGSSKEEQHHGAAAQLQVLPEEIRQVCPPYSLCEAEDSLLSFVRKPIFSMAMTMTMPMVVVMVVVVVVVVAVAVAMVTMVTVATDTMIGVAVRATA